MRSWNVVVKGVCLAAAIGLLAACETAPEDAGGGAGSTGQAPQSSSGAAAPTGSATSEKMGPERGSQEELDLTVGSLVFFDFDRHELKPDALATVELWANWLKERPAVTVTLEGHCDERGPRLPRRSAPKQVPDAGVC